jgi:hypothetical protein
MTHNYEKDIHCFYCHLAAPLMANGLPPNRATLQTQREITIANDLIGCIIGRGGQKISEIRWESFLFI